MCISWGCMCIYVPHMKHVHQNLCPVQSVTDTQTHTQTTDSDCLRLNLASQISQKWLQRYKCRSTTLILCGYIDVTLEHICTKHNQLQHLLHIVLPYVPETNVPITSHFYAIYGTSFKGIYRG